MASFSSEEDAIIINMVELQHAGWGSIAVKVGHPPNVCAQRYRILRREAIEAIPIMTVAEIDAKKFGGSLVHVFNERDEREAAKTKRDEAAQRSGWLTSTFCGDPPPGYSALDRRRSA